MSRNLKIFLIAGARPNFMKISPIYKELRKYRKISTLLIHTGQHYDTNMSKIFFDHLEIPKPDINIEVGSDTHARQTAEIMIRFEPILLEKKPDLVVVVGDVNSTLACSLVASKLHIKVAHVEAGLRSRNWKMPEEVNRVLTDRLSDFLFTTSRDASNNLIQEGIEREKTYFVGNVMIDTLLNNIGKADKSTILHDLGLMQKNYAVLTLHRPSNVDNKKKLFNIIQTLREIQERIPIIYPAHPRTKETLRKFGLINSLQSLKNIKLSEPLGYIDFLKLMKHAKFIMTDSGGIQEETTILGIPCLTLRKETERPVTVTQGTNTIVGVSQHKIKKEVERILQDKNTNKNRVPEKWDGKASKRIVEIVIHNFL